VRYGLRRLVAQLALRRALSAIALGSALLAAQAAGAASEHPKVFVPRFPASQEHTEFVVEVNAKGQVTRVRSGRASPDAAFNTMTYGNALQVFIRTQYGKAIAGVFRLTYDYNPQSRLVSRHVFLVHPGGVNPNALGAVDEMAAINRRRAGSKRARSR